MKSISKSPTKKHSEAYKEAEKLKADFPLGPEYQVLKQIGKGSYGTVALAQHKPTGRMVAVKKLEDIFVYIQDAKRLTREILLQRVLSKHRNVVKLYEVILQGNRRDFNSLFLVFEYIESDLRKVFRSYYFLTERHIQTIVYNLLCGVHFIHSAEVIHRDIKPGNVLITQDCTAKICDFGLARQLEGVISTDDFIQTDFTQFGLQKNLHQLRREMASGFLIDTAEARQSRHRTLTSHVATRFYRAPELILMEKDYGKPVDIWAVGVIFGELLLMIEEHCPQFEDRSCLFPGKYCFPLSPKANQVLNDEGIPLDTKNDQLEMIFDLIGTPNNEELSFVSDEKAQIYLKKFVKRKPADLRKKFKECHVEGLKLLSAMLQFNPFFRPTIEECLASPYFDKVRQFSTIEMSESLVDFEFERQEQTNFSQLRKLILAEADHYQGLKLAGLSELSPQVVKPSLKLFDAKPKETGTKMK